MIDKDDIQLSRNSALIISAFLILLMGIFLLIGSVSIPFIGESPETMDATDAISISETDDNVVLKLKQNADKENIKLSVDGQEYAWDNNNTITFKKAELLDNIRVDSYTGDNIYDTYVYNSQKEKVGIKSSSDLILNGTEYSFETTTLSASFSDFESITWSIDGEFVERNTPVIINTFDTNGTHTVSATVDIDGVTYTTTKQVNVVEPDEVVLDAEVDKTEVTILEELNFNVTEVSEQNVESFRWNLGDNTTKFGENIGHWYQEPGQYNITVTGESEDTGAIGTDTLNVTVVELNESVNTYQLTINTFDSTNNTRLNGTSISINNVTRDLTASNSQVEFNLQEDEYDISVEKEDYQSVTKSINLSSNRVEDIRLAQIITEEETEDEGAEELTNEELETEDSSEETGVNFEPEQNTQENVEEPEGFELILSNMDGNGTAESPYRITTISELQAIEAEPTASYILGNDINAAQTQVWNFVGLVEDESLGMANKTEYETNYNSIEENSEEISVNGNIINKSNYTINYNTGDIIFNNPLSDKSEYNIDSTVKIDYNADNSYNGFTPIESANFAPEIDGNGHVISNIHINRPDENNVGIFRNIEGGAIYDLTIGGHYVSGYNSVGGLVGNMDGGFVDNVRIAGAIQGQENIGGLIGETSRTNITNVNALIAVNGQQNVGGITGYANENANITKSAIQTAEGRTISGYRNVGGIIGDSYTSNINTSYSLAVIYGSENIGGLVGAQREESTLNESYATSTVVGESVETRGGLVGVNNGEVNNTYWDVLGTNQYNAAGTASESIISSNVVGLETNQMVGTSVFDNMNLFDFDNTWEPSNTYPKFIDTEESSEPLSSEVEGLQIYNTTSDEVVEIGNVISNTPEYRNRLSEEITVNIIESNITVHSFDISEEQDLFVNNHQVKPNTNNHLLESYARLEGYRFDSNNMEFDVVYTALDENRNEVEYERQQFIVNIENSEDINPTVNVTGDIDNGEKTGLLTNFNLLSGNYNVEITADGYYTKQANNTDIINERVVYNTELDKRPTSNLTVNMNSNSVVEFNEETKSGTSLSFNNIPAGDYLIEINRNNIDELQKEMITIDESDKSISYNFDSPKITVVAEDGSSGEQLNANITIESNMIENTKRIGVDKAHFGDLEAGEYSITVKKDVYETNGVKITHYGSEDINQVVKLHNHENHPHG
jgi:hypothetical protein